MRAFDERHPEDRDAEPGEGFCCTYCYKEFTDEEWMEDGEKLFQLPYLSDEEKMEHYTEAYCSQCSWNTCQTNELCENCIFYGIWDEDNKQVSNLDNLLPEGIVPHQKRSGRLLTPSVSTIASNNWQWMGQSCYGTDGDGHFTPEQYRYLDTCIAFVSANIFKKMKISYLQKTTTGLSLGVWNDCHWNVANIFSVFHQQQSIQ